MDHQGHGHRWLDRRTCRGPGAVGSTDVVSGATFKADTYTLSETGPSGYAASALDLRQRCDRHREPDHAGPRPDHDLHDHQRRHPAEGHGHQGPEPGQRSGSRSTSGSPGRRTRPTSATAARPVRSASMPAARTRSTRPAARSRRPTWPTTRRPSTVGAGRSRLEHHDQPAARRRNDLHDHQHDQGRRRRRHPGLPRLLEPVREPRGRPDRPPDALPAGPAATRRSRRR